MKKVDVNSEEFRRGMALYFLKEHKRETQFQVNTSMDQTILEELKRRGCDVVLESKKGLYTISSPLAFGNLVTRAEWKQHRLELVGGIGLFVLTKGGYIAVIALAVSLNVGLLTVAIWVFGWVFLSSAAFPDCKPREKIKWVLIGLLLFGAGIVVRVLGWSTAR